MRITLYIKNRTICLFGTFLLSMTTFFLNAGTPHIVGGTVTYSGGGSPPSASFSAYVTSRSGDILTQSSVGCGYSGGSYWVQVGNFDNAWTAGEVFRIEISDGTGGYVSGEIDLTNGPGDQLDLTIYLPDISISPDEVNCGNVLVGSSNTENFTVENAGGSTLSVNSISITGADANEFDISGGGRSFNLSQGEDHTVDVRFHPSSLGSKNATLIIENNDPDESTLYLPLSGTGVVPSISASPNPVDYGNVSVDSYSDKIIVISNSGSGNLNISSASVTGSGASDFSIHSGGGIADLAPGSTHDIVVRYSPASIGTIGASLRIESNDPDNNPYYVDLEGTGLAPDISASPDPADFGNLNLGTYSDITITVRNNGNTDLDIHSTNITGINAGQFSIESGGGSVTLISGGTHDIVVRCSSESAGEINAGLSIESNDPDENPYTLALMCTGNAPDISIVPSYSDYGNVLKGDSSINNFTITNMGNSTLNVTLTNITGADAGDFTITGGEGSFSLNIGETHNIDVRFIPTSAAVRHAMLHIESDDPDEGVLDIPLSGTGVEPEIVATPDTVEYGNVNINTYSDFTIQISNTGSGELIISSTSISGSGASYFTIQSGGGSVVIMPGSTHDIVVRFSPLSEGAAVAGLNITSNNPDENPLVLSLTGNCVGIPDILISPASKNFGNVLVGTGSNQTFTVTNTGTGTLTVSSMIFSGVNLDDFSIGEVGGFTLSPSTSYPLQVKFMPVKTGTESATLILINDDPDEDSVKITLTGKGVSTPVPGIAIEPLFVNYGIVPLDSAGEKTFFILNNGNADLIITNVFIDGSDTDNFTVEELTFPVTLNPDSSFDIKVLFNPDNEADMTADMNIVNNDSDNDTLKVTLSGTGYMPNSNPPYIMHFYPGHGSQEVARNVGLQLKIVDEVDGINLNTLNISIDKNIIVSDGIDQTDGNVKIINDLHHCSVFYIPINCLPENHAVSVKIQCRDLSLFQNELDSTLSFNTGRYIPVITTKFALGSGGGTVTDTSADIELSIPENALKDSVYIFVGIIDSLKELPSLPDTVSATDHAFYFGIDGLLFNKPVMIGIPYTQDDLNIAGVSDPADLLIYYFSVSAGEWKFRKVIDYDDNHIYIIVNELGSLIIGKSTITEINDFKAGDNIRNESVLFQNYPNPVIDKTTISFSIPKSGRILLRIYDADNRVQEVLINQYFPAGKYDILWDAAYYPCGIYFYQLQTDEYSLVKKMIVK